MYVSPRVVYGLNEHLVLLPYERGERKARLVLRARALGPFLLRACLDKEVTLLGSPVALGDLVDGRSPIPMTPRQKPERMRGDALERQRGRLVYWMMRQYRVTWSMAGSVRFEAGNKLMFHSHTLYYLPEQLLALCEARDEPKPCARLP